MSLVATIDNDLKTALLNHDKETVDLLRLIKAAFKNEMINLKKKEEPLTDEEALKILKQEARKRHDSIEQFQAGNRPDLVEIETKELALIKKYLPAELSVDKIREVAAEVVAAMGEVSPSQFGAVMKSVMARLAGAADGKVVSQIVK